MTLEASREVAPLSGIDEYMIHNYPQPQRVMYTSDLRAYERLWFTCQDRAGELMVVTGIGFYPNLDTADAYGIVNRRGAHTHVRYHRRLGINRMDMRMGPLNFEVVEPFKTWKLTLGDNPHGIRFEIYWHDAKRPIFSPFLLGFEQPNVTGPARLDSVGYEGFGRMEGWVEVQGERFTIDDSFNGSRDHHWGARAGVGGEAANGPRPALSAERPRPIPHAGQWVEFGDWSIWGIRNLLPWGAAQPGAGRYLITDRRLKFDSETGEFVEGIFTDVTETGEQKELHFRRLGSQSAFLRFGGYGPSPDGGLEHGVYPGQDTLFGGTHDMTKAAARAAVLGLEDHHCEVSCGTETVSGLLECFDPGLRECSRVGLPGFRFLGERQ